MKGVHEHLPQDLQTLRYLDALNVGDLEAVAALWEEASRNPELERTLAEFDGALFVEHTTVNVQAAAQCVPEFPAARRRWAAWAGVVGALAAACVLAVLAWSRHDSKSPQLSHPSGDSMRPITPRAPDDFASIPAWPEGRRIVDGAEMATFHWPLPEASPIARSTWIPPDVLE